MTHGILFATPSKQGLFEILITIKTNTCTLQNDQFFTEDLSSYTSKFRAYESFWGPSSY